MPSKDQVRAECSTNSARYRKGRRDSEEKHHGALNEEKIKTVYATVRNMPSLACLGCDFDESIADERLP